MSDQDLVFRIVVLVLFVGVRYVRWHARQLDWLEDHLAGHEETRSRHVVLLTLSVAWLTAVVVYVGLPDVWWHDFRRRYPIWIRWCAVAAAAAGLALIWWADHCLGQNLSVSLRIRDHHTLVTADRIAQCDTRFTQPPWCTPRRWRSSPRTICWPRCHRPSDDPAGDTASGTRRTDDDRCVRRRISRVMREYWSAVSEVASILRRCDKDLSRHSLPIRVLT